MAEEMKLLLQASEMKEKGLIDDDEFSKLKARILSSNQSLTPAPAPAPETASTEICKLVAGVTSLVGVVAAAPMFQAAQAPLQSPLQKRPATYKSVVTGESMAMDCDLTSDDVVPVDKPNPKPQAVLGCKRQATIFDKSVQSVVSVNGKKIKVSKPLSDAQPLLTAKQKDQQRDSFKCRWCDQSFNHGPARAAHEKKHSGPMRGQASLFDLKKVKQGLNEREKDREIAVQVRWCVNDIIKELEKSEIKVTFVDGKKPVKFRKDGKVG